MHTLRVPSKTLGLNDEVCGDELKEVICTDLLFAS